MAEGGECSISVRGSDACFEHACTPCADEGDNQEAQKYCLECKEYLCATCVKHHQKVSATKMHTLCNKDFESVQQDSINTTTADDKMFKCLFHPDRDIEMFCGAHEMVYCLLCIARDHRLCNGILELEEAAEKAPENTKEVLLQHIDKLKPDIQGTLQKKNDNQTSLEQERNNILKTIEDKEVSIIEKVKELASNAKSKTSVRYDDLKEELQKEISTLLQGITDMDELKNEVETQKESDRNRKFVRYILQKRTITQTQNIHDSVGKDERKIKCFMNNELIRRISTTDCFADIAGSKSSLDSRTNVMHGTIQKEVTIETDLDEKTCTIHGISQLSDGAIIVADYANEKLKKLNGKFSIIGEFDLKSPPTGICLISNNEIAVKMENNTIKIISINGKFMKKLSIYIKGGKHVGLVSFCDELWCFTGKNITVYDRTGTVTKIINRKSFQGTIFQPTGKDIVPVLADRHFIYVSDLDNKVACLDRDGNVWAVLKNERLKRVRAACFARSGIICLAGYTSGNIMMFNEEGKCLGELVNGLKAPGCLFYDSRTNQLMVGHDNKKFLTIIKTDESL